MLYKQKFNVSQPKKYTPWTDKEHKRFVEAVRLHGKDWDLITQHVGTRSKPQNRSHFGVFEKQVKVNPDLPDSDIIDILRPKVAIDSETEDKQ